MFDNSGSYFIMTRRGMIASVILTIITTVVSFGAFYYVSKTQQTALQVKIQEAQTAAGDANKNMVALQGRLDSLQKVWAQDASLNKQRLTLLSTLFNENFAAVSAGNPRDAIYVERDWKVRRLPKYLDMTQEDVDWFSQFMEEGAIGSPQVPK